MVWVCTPRRSSSCSSFRAVVVLPEPEGPERRTMGLSFIRSRMRSAAVSSRFWYTPSHSATNPAGSSFRRRLISSSW